MTTSLDKRERALVERLKDRDYRNEYLLDAREIGDTVYLYSAVYWSCYAVGIGKVAEAVGVSRKQISRLRDAEHSPRWEVMEDILAFLGVDTVQTLLAKLAEAEAKAKAA